MRLAFVTMVWRDYWLLDKWVRHNAQYVDRRSLYVINHGGDPRVEEIAAGCNIINIPRDEVTVDLTRRRWDLLGGLTNGLLGFYGWVICTDVDELIVYAGTDGTLLDHLANSTAETTALSPVGLNLIPTGEGDVNDGVLNLHHNAMLSAKYTKPCIARSRVVYTIGGHGLVRGKFTIDPQILLFHLHYVTPDYADRMAQRKDIVAESVERNETAADPVSVGKRFWINWSNPEMIREKELSIFAQASELPVEQGFDHAAELLRAAVRHTDKKMVVDHAVMNKSPQRVTVPERLRDLI
ncbi:glycosyltransferase family 2 protein [Thalassovita taeanensis]|uniref:Glycosyl transferase family 2 n=1 Tax=Thalassovita taeanensis TaxID=657014 RepID=A0A1H9HMY3_9RHOB|nr:glycosyltransferase family 2 protein [Thalassovita taeanensis]SEQ63701.1 hypothetical protein SAMN04488092_1102 [Thalassovita taeanensis]